MCAARRSAQGPSKRGLRPTQRIIDDDGASKMRNSYETTTIDASRGGEKARATAEVYRLREGTRECARMAM